MPVFYRLRASALVLFSRTALGRSPTAIVNGTFVSQVFRETYLE